MDKYIIAYDIGTTSLKTCLFKITDKINLISSVSEGYELILIDKDKVEQNPLSWWTAMCKTTHKVLNQSNVSRDLVQGVAICAQMQGLVLVDKNGEAIRNSMSYMDSRASKEYEEGIASGVKVDGLNVYKVVKSLNITGAAAASVKDPVWKYKWVEKHEPQNFSNVYKWLDVKEYLICKATGEFVMTEDSAYATLLYDIRHGHKCFSKEMCHMLGVKYNHLPKIVKSTDIVGYLNNISSLELGLNEGTAVLGGGGDASLIGIGAGAIDTGETHVYLGTSGWVSTVVKKRKSDITHRMASIVGARENHYNFFAEMETAGKCLEWVKDHLALDEIGMYLNKKDVTNNVEENYKNLYSYMIDAIKDVPAGSNGVIFTPWLSGNRCPFEDSNARGMFININITTGKREMIHSVLEGICYNIRWMLEISKEMVVVSPVIRLVGGGALEPLTCQILADILGNDIETVKYPQNVGAVGAAVVAAIGLNMISGFEEAKSFIEIDRKYIANKDNKIIYDKYFKIYKDLYKSNRRNFSLLNR